MSSFHQDSTAAPAGGDRASFEVVGADRKIVRYERDDFDEIFETTDAEEMQRQVDLGWLLLDQRTVQGADRGPSGMDTLPGIEGLRVGGLFGYETGEELTAYLVGYLKDGAVGTPVE